MLLGVLVDQTKSLRQVTWYIVAGSEFVTKPPSAPGRAHPAPSVPGQAQGRRQGTLLAHMGVWFCVTASGTCPFLVPRRESLRKSIGSRTSRRDQQQLWDPGSELQRPVGERGDLETTQISVRSSALSLHQYNLSQEDAHCQASGSSSQNSSTTHIIDVAWGPNDTRQWPGTSLSLCFHNLWHGDLRTHVVRLMLRPNSAMCYCIGHN